MQIAAGRLWSQFVPMRGQEPVSQGCINKNRISAIRPHEGSGGWMELEAALQAPAQFVPMRGQERALTAILPSTNRAIRPHEGSGAYALIAVMRMSPGNSSP